MMQNDDKNVTDQELQEEKEKDAKRMKVAL